MTIGLEVRAPRKIGGDMCTFFSGVSDGKGKFYYFNAKLRKKRLKGELRYEPDSHTSIADYFGYQGKDEDKLNKYEYDPITKFFRIDQLNTTDDSRKIEKICRNLDFKKIMPELIIKDIIHPFKLKERKPTKVDVVLLKKWASVNALLVTSVRDSVWDSISGSLGFPFRDWFAVSFGSWFTSPFVTSFGYAFSDPLWAYSSSFLSLQQWKYVKHKKGYNPYTPAIKLWEKGLVPSFDGKIWRLHSGENARIVLRIKEDELIDEKIKINNE